MNRKQFNQARAKLFQDKAEREARQFLGFVYSN